MNQFLSQSDDPSQASQWSSSIVILVGEKEREVPDRLTVWPPRLFPLSVRARPRTVLSTNTSSLLFLSQEVREKRRGFVAPSRAFPLLVQDFRDTCHTLPRKICSKTRDERTRSRHRRTRKNRRKMQNMPPPTPLRSARTSSASLGCWEAGAAAIWKL